MKPAKIASLLCIIFIMLAASACGNQSNQTTASPTPASNHQEQGQVEQQTENEAQGTRSFTDAYGRTVELPARPERVVAHYFASEVTALEGNLIGTNHINAKISLNEQQLASIAEIGGDGVGVNMEAILALSPDLIIIPNFLDEEAVAKLEKIATTVVLDYGEEPFQRLLKIGQLLNVEDKAEQWIAHYEARAAEKRSLLQNELKEGETASAFILHSNQKLYVYGYSRLGPTLYDALGLMQPQSVTDLFAGNESELWKEISLEVLPDYAGDRVFFVDLSNDEAQTADRQELLNSSIWTSLPAFQNGHAYVVDQRWAQNDPLTLDWLLDQATELLLGQSNQ